MSLDGYYASMLDYGMDVLDEFAEDVASFEEHPITVTLPPRPGRKPTTLEIRGYFDENPAPHAIASTGIKASLNGILYVRRDQTPEDLRRSAEDGSIAAGYRFTVRGREYRCIKADYARREYAFALSDLNETPDGRP